MKGWLDFYENGGEVNANDDVVRIPPNFVGIGNSTKGFNYNGAWGGQFEDGGAVKKVLSYTPVIAGAKKLMSNFAENVNAFEYDNALGRIGKNAFLNQKSLRRIEDEQNPDQQFKERADLLNLLANKKQKYNSIPLSEYKPSTSKDKNTQYYKSPSTEDQIQEYINTHWTAKNILSKEDLPKMRSKALGNMMLDYGTDEKGNYISYYDKWDLNPIPQTGVNWLDKAVDKVVTGVPNALGITNTPEVYGRVYLPEKRNGGELKKLEDLTNFGQIYKNKWLQKYE